MLRPNVLTLVSLVPVYLVFGCFLRNRPRSVTHLALYSHDSPACDPTIVRVTTGFLPVYLGDLSFSRLEEPSLECSHSLLQGIFPTQGLNPRLLHYRWVFYRLSHQEASDHFHHLHCYCSRSSQPPPPVAQISGVISQLGPPVCKSANFHTASSMDSLKDNSHEYPLKIIYDTAHLCFKHFSLHNAIHIFKMVSKKCNRLNQMMSTFWSKPSIILRRKKRERSCYAFEGPVQSKSCVLGMLSPVHQLVDPPWPPHCS